MIKINTKLVKEDSLALSFLPITRLIEKKKIRDKFKIELIEKSGRSHYYIKEADYKNFKDFLTFMKQSYKNNKKRTYENITNSFDSLKNEVKKRAL
jgi:hypothetical protein